MQDSRQFSEVLNVRIPRDLAEAMRDAAHRDDRTVSSWVRHNIKRIVTGDDCGIARLERREVSAQ
jgi:predicted HicB family RNase H-like nuclease